MLSKSKGQVLRISPAFHVLFHVKKEVTQQVVTIRLTKTIMRNMKIKMTNTKIKMANTKTKMKNDYDPICTEISEQAVAAAINFV